VQAKEAELGILRDSEELRRSVTELGGLYTKEQAARRVNFFMMGIFALGVLLSAFAIVKVLLEDTRQRALKPRSMDAGRMARRKRTHE
jgi:hypothetical protein